MRAIGRRRICGVPEIKLVNFCPANNPVSSRTVVPELPQSNTSVGSCSPSSPRPWIANSVGERSSTTTPSPRMTPMVARQSPPSRKLRTVLVPSAMAENMTERWLIDLSPGT